VQTDGDWQSTDERDEPPFTGDPCPACGEADLEPMGGKHACPECGYLQPCCNP